MLELLTIACTMIAVIAARAGDTIVASAAVMSLAALVLALAAIN
jgi:hypothetical protein